LSVKVGGTYGDHCALNSVSSVGILFSLGWQNDRLIRLLRAQLSCLSMNRIST